MHSARVLMWSFDFGEIEALQHAGRWDDAGALLAEAARRLERGGADFVLICTNTMHRMADGGEAAIGIPLLHIADPTAGRIQAAGLLRASACSARPSPWSRPSTRAGSPSASGSTCWCRMRRTARSCTA